MDVENNQHMIVVRTVISARSLYPLNYCIWFITFWSQLYSMDVPFLFFIFLTSSFHFEERLLHFSSFVLYFEDAFIAYWREFNVNGKQLIMSIP